MMSEPSTRRRRTDRAREFLVESERCCRVTDICIALKFISTWRSQTRTHVVFAKDTTYTYVIICYSPRLRKLQTLMACIFGTQESTASRTGSPSDLPGLR